MRNNKEKCPGYSFYYSWRFFIVSFELFFFFLFFLISMILPFEKYCGLITYNLTCQTGYNHLSYLEELCNISVIAQWSLEADVLGYIVPYGIPDVWILCLPKNYFKFQRKDQKNESIFPSLDNTFVLLALGNEMYIWWWVFVVVVGFIFNDW